MSEPASAHLDRRGRLNLAAGGWLAGIGLYLTCLAVLFWPPSPLSNTGFDNIAVDPSQEFYWSGLHLPYITSHVFAFGSYPGMTAAAFGIWANLALVVIAVLVCLKRRYTLLIGVVLAWHLSNEAAGTLTQLYGKLHTGRDDLTAAMRVGMAEDAAAPTPTASALSQSPLLARFCDAGAVQAALSRPDGWTWQVNCDPAAQQTLLHYELMQWAYLHNDAATAKRHFQALDEDKAPSASYFTWRIRVVREWLMARQMAPADPKSDLHASLEAFRCLSIIAFIAGPILLIAGAALAAIGAILRARVRRIQHLETLTEPL